MKIFDKLFRLFNKQSDNSNIPRIKSKYIKGQDLIYWQKFLDKKKLKIIWISIIVFFSLLFIIDIFPIEDLLYINNFKYDYPTYRGDSNDKISYNFVYNYEDNYKLLEEELKINPTDFNILRYSIVCMKLGKYYIAQENLLKISNNSIFSEDAQWYLALSYLKTDKEMAIKEFEKISNNKEHYKNEDAKKIIFYLKIFP